MNLAMMAAVPELPPRAKIVGTICANQHPRIVHYEAQCPLCLVIASFLASAEHNERLIDEAHYRQAELDSVLDRIRELDTTP